MTQPLEPIGASPVNAAQVNALVGQHLQAFVTMQETIAHDQSWLAGVSLQAEPYGFTADQETTIKTAINGLNTSLQAVDMTFIDRLTGMFS